MGCKLFVGGISWNTGEAELTSAFAGFGEIRGVHIATDRETQRPRGFAFVTFARPEDALSAMEGLNGSKLDGRTIRVDEAEEKRGGGGVNLPRNRVNSMPEPEIVTRTRGMHGERRVERSPGGERPPRRPPTFRDY